MCEILSNSFDRNNDEVLDFLITPRTNYVHIRIDKNKKSIAYPL
jgi:hypothetical protein